MNTNTRLYTNTHFFYKNKVYMNIETQGLPKFKNKLRIWLRLNFVTLRTLRKKKLYVFQATSIKNYPAFVQYIEMN